MILTYYTYRALAAEWRQMLAGGIVEEVYSQTRGELVLRISGRGADHALHIHPMPPDRYLFRRDGARRRGRNVIDVLPRALGCRIEDVQVARRDRVLTFLLGGDRRLVFVLFGARANVLLSGADGRVEASFLNPGSMVGTRVPEPVAAAGAAETRELAAGWSGRGTTARAVQRAIPLFDDVAAQEVVRRSGGVPVDADDCREADLHRLLEEARELEKEFYEPVPAVRDVGGSPQFSLFAGPEGTEEERFGSVDEAVREYWIRVLGRSATNQAIEPFRQSLERELDRVRRSVDRMEAELDSEGRADLHERYGHLLMTVSDGSLRGQAMISLPDVFDEGRVVEIALDADLSLHENAGRYYERARQSRGARASARQRLGEQRERMAALREAADQARRVISKRDAERFVKEHSGLLPNRGTGGRGPGVPGHRFDLGGGVLAIVGRNARENDAITFGYARKEDLWMHARGYPGSHVVVRVPARSVRPPRDVIEAAASIAAYYSKARGSELVPVMVTQRKYVRKARGGVPGKVVVEREEVFLVPPALPTGGRGLAEGTPTTPDRG